MVINDGTTNIYPASPPGAGTSRGYHYRWRCRANRRAASAEKETFGYAALSSERKDKNIVILDIIQVLKAIHLQDPTLDVQTVGGAEAIVEIQYRKRKLSTVLFIGVWLLLFIGSCLAIMNFHEDVSMRDVHIALYEIITGERNDYPYLLQIPYSIGLGLGMIVFFNHIFKSA